MEGGRIRVRFDPGQRSLFLAPVSSANTIEKRPLLAGKLERSLVEHSLDYIHVYISL